MRDVICLNGMWEYKADPDKKGSIEKWMTKTDAGDSSWIRTNLPNALECISRDQFITFKGEVWFWRQITLSKEFEERRLELIFHRILPKGEIFLEGKSLGTHEKGDVPYRIVLPKMPTEKPLSLMVRLFGFEDRISNKANWTGILDNIEMKLSGALTFENYRIQAYPKDNYTKAHLDCHFDVMSNFNTDVYSQVAIRILNAGKEVFSKLENFKAMKDTSSHIIVSTDFDSPHFWSIEDPFLYDLDVRLTRTNQIQDNFTARFGIREMGFKDNRVNINGKSVLLKGIKYQPSVIASGPVISTNQIRFDLQQMKHIGINCIYIQEGIPESVLSLADELGLVAISKVETSTIAERIKNQASHSSAFGWVLPSGLSLINITAEYGANLNFFQESSDASNKDINPLVIQITRPEMLEIIPSQKLTRIVVLNCNTIKGKISHSFHSPIEGTEEAQISFFKQAIKSLNSHITGIIFGDWIDAGVDQPYLDQNMGILTEHRLPKAGYYYLLNNLC